MKSSTVAQSWRIEVFLKVPYLISCVVSSNYSDKRCRLFIKGDCLPGPGKRKSQAAYKYLHGHDSSQQSIQSGSMHYYHLLGQVKKPLSSAFPAPCSFLSALTLLRCFHTYLILLYSLCSSRTRTSAEVRKMVKSKKAELKAKIRK